MLLNKKARRQKELLKLDTERRKLEDIRRDYPTIELNPPIQTGWEKTFELRDDCTRRSDADVYRRILGVINRKVFCRRKDFVDKWSKKPVILELDIIGEGQWEKLDWPEHYKKYFTFGDWVDRCCTITKKIYYKRGYKFNQPFYFVERIDPYLMTHRKVMDGEVEGRIGEINDKFYRDNLWTELAKYENGSTYSWRENGDTWKYRYLNPDDVRVYKFIESDDQVEQV